MTVMTNRCVMWLQTLIDLDWACFHGNERRESEQAQLFHCRLNLWLHFRRKHPIGMSYGNAHFRVGGH